MNDANSRPFEITERMTGGFQAQYRRGEWHIVVPNHVTLEELNRPAAWVHLSSKLKRFDKVDVLTEDGMLDVSLRVIRIENRLVWFHPLTIYEDKARVVEAKPGTTPVETEAQDAEPVPAGYKIGHAPNGATVGFWVKYNSTGDLLFRGLPTRAAALQKAIDHAKAAGTYQAPAKAA